MSPPVTLLFASWVALAPAQSTEPLRKTELMRLLTGSVFSTQETAVLIARNCLSFMPTSRDRNDLRVLGADSLVMAAIDECGRKRAPLSVAPLEPRVAGVAGTSAVIKVAVERGGRPEAGVRLVLRGSRRIIGGPVRDVQSVTDEQGVATFTLPTGTRTGTYQLRVASVSGDLLEGRTVVALATAPAAPAVAELRPSRLEVRPRDAGRYGVTVIVRDRFGNPVPGQPVQLRPGETDRGIATVSGVTNALGVVAFALVASSFRRPTDLGVLVGGRPMASLKISPSFSISVGQTGFVSGGGQHGVVGTRLSQALVFRVRDSANAALPGLTVSLAAADARLVPEQAITDSAGVVRIAVVLGEKAGPAVVTATVDSLQKQVTVYATPGPAVKLVAECNGKPLGGQLVVDSQAVLRVVARDGFGNATRLTGLRVEVDNRGVLRVQRVASDSLSATVTLRPRATGWTTLTIEGSGYRTPIRTAVVPSGAAPGPACR